MVTTTTLVSEADEVTVLVWSVLPWGVGAAVTIFTSVGVEATVLVLLLLLLTTLVAALASGLAGAAKRGGLDVTMTYFCGAPGSDAVGTRGVGTSEDARGAA